MRTKILFILFIILSLPYSIEAGSRLDTLRSQAKQMMARENDTYTPNVTWDHSINAGLRSAAGLCSCYVKLDTIALTVGQREDALNSDFAFIRTAYNKTEDLNLVQILEEQAAYADFPGKSDGKVGAFYIRGKTIGWRIIPLNPDSIIISYYASHPTLSNAGDTAILALEFELGALELGVAEILRREKEYGQADYYQKLGATEIGLQRLLRQRKPDILYLKQEKP